MTDNDLPLILLRAAAVAGLTDINGPGIIEVVVTDDGRLWVNVDGICHLRAQQVGQVRIEDRRKTPGGKMQ